MCSCCPTTHDTPQAAAKTATASAAAEAGIEVHVVRSRSAVQGIAALAVFEPAASAQNNLVAMSGAAAATRYGAVTVASKEAQTSAGWCHPGDVLGVVGDDVVAIGHDLAGRDRADSWLPDLRSPSVAVRPGVISSAGVAPGFSLGGRLLGRGSVAATSRSASSTVVSRPMRCCWGWSDVADLSTPLGQVVGKPTASPLAKYRNLHTVGDLLDFVPVGTSSPAS